MSEWNSPDGWWPNDPQNDKDPEFIECPECQGEKGEMLFDEDTQQLEWEKCENCRGEGEVERDYLDN